MRTMVAWRMGDTHTRLQERRDEQLAPRDDDQARPLQLLRGGNSGDSMGIIHMQHAAWRHSPVHEHAPQADLPAQRVHDPPLQEIAEMRMGAHPLGRHILGGDFNAKLGPDDVASWHNAMFPEAVRMQRRHKSPDRRGAALRDWLMAMGMQWVGSERMAMQGTWRRGTQKVQLDHVFMTRMDLTAEEHRTWNFREGRIETMDHIRKESADDLVEITITLRRPRRRPQVHGRK